MAAIFYKVLRVHHDAYRNELQAHAQEGWELLSTKRLPEAPNGRDDLLLFLVTRS
jgi:hypothetical protein